MSNLDQRTMLELVFGEQEGNIVVGLMDRAGPKGQLNRSWDFHWPSQADDVVNFFNQHVTSDAYFSPLAGECHLQPGDLPGQRRVPA